MALNFDSSTMMELQNSIEHDCDIHTARVSDKYMVTCSGKVIRVFNVADLSEMTYSPITHHRYHMISCVISPDNRFFICTSMDGRASVIDPVTGKVITMLSHPKEVGMRACCLSNRLNGLLALGATDGLISVYETTSFTLLKSLNANNDEGINSLCFSQDNLHLISGSSSGEFRLWDGLYLNETPIRTVFSAHEEPVLSITMLDTIRDKGMISSYRFITGGGDNLIKIWKTDIPANGSKPVVMPVTTLIGHTGPVYDCDLTTDKRFLMSCGGDYTFRVWSMETFDSVYVQVGAHTKFINGCRFTKDMRCVITAATDKLCHVWRITDTFGLSHSVKPDLIQLSEDQVDSTNKVNMMKSLISCPITHEVMTDPVILSDGYSYEKSAIESWLADGKVTSPMTNGHLTSLTIIPNHTLKALIQSLSRDEHH